MNKLNFITDRLPEFKSSDSLPAACLFSIHLQNKTDVANISLANIHRLAIDSQPSRHFSICINFDSQENAELLAALIQNQYILLQLFFHPHFEKKNNAPVIFLCATAVNRSFADKFIAAFELTVRKQGYDGISVVFLNEASSNLEEGNQWLYKCKNGQALKEWYYQVLTKNYYLSNYVAVINQSEHSPLELMRLKIAAEDAVEQEHPLFYSFIKKHITFSEKIPFLEEELKQTQEDLENQKTYLRIMKTEDEAGKINDFYFYEYEILPLWYKRFGHLLKVLTGKRNFRSLFDNNVKKYKD